MRRALAAAATVLTALVALAACPGESEGDFDGDGVRDSADCDAADPTVYPGAPDAYGDGTDSNCDGADGIDSDGDGFVQQTGDCDDLDATVHPDAEEIPGNGKDDDCDGVTDEEGDDDDSGDDDDAAGDDDDDDDAAGDDDDSTAWECEPDDYAGHTYWFCRMYLTGADAQAACASFGADLVTISSFEENDFVATTAELIAPVGYVTWIGLNDLEEEGEWEWYSGAASDFRNWPGVREQRRGPPVHLRGRLTATGLQRPIGAPSATLPRSCATNRSSSPSSSPC